MFFRRFNAAGHGGDFAGIAMLGRDLSAVIHGENDRRRGQHDLERHAVVMRVERLAVSPDLVADGAIGGDVVGAGDDAGGSAARGKSASGFEAGNRQ